MAVRDEEELLVARRAFPTAQELLAGSTTRVVAGEFAVGWHDSAVEPEQGAVALVQLGAGLGDLIGEVVRVTNQNGRFVYVWILQEAVLPVAVSVSRRAFFPELGLLPQENVPCTLEVVA